MPLTASAVGTGSGDWYWPVGTENFQGWDGWWVYRPGNHSWHMAQDMPRPVGSPVYAIGDGTIIESRPASGYGGVFVLLHKTGDGQYFKAVYGHMYRGAGLEIGSKVRAGQVIGRVNGDRHLHFGIHPGKAYPPDNNPFRGHTYVRSQTYGWTDPVAYLRNHPRTLTYKAPALPAIATIETTEQPTVLGVADGRAYWRIGSGDLATLFSRSLGATSAPEPAAATPTVLDTVSYPSNAATSAFVLFDARPMLSIDRSTHVPEWDRPVLLTGYLTNVIGRPFMGARIVIERSVDGGPWSRVATVTAGINGGYRMPLVPKRRQVVRARFVAPRLYVPGESRCVTIAPRPEVSVPAVPSWIGAGRSFTARGTLYPRHAAGPGATVLRIQKKTGDTWADFSQAPTTYRDSTAGTAYAASVKLARGTWRVRAETPPDDRHAAKVTGWRSFVVR